MIRLTRRRATDVAIARYPQPATRGVLRRRTQTSDGVGIERVAPPLGAVRSLASLLGELGRCRRGVAALEFALASIPLLALIFGFMACNLVFYCLTVMQNNAQYAALMVATGQVTSINTGTITSANNTATTTCRSSMVGTQAEYYACTGLPSWATFNVTTTESCAVPSVTVTLSANASSAALTDIYAIFAGKTVSTTAVMMKQGTCP